MRKLRTAIFITAFATSLTGFADSQYNSALGSSGDPEPEDSATARYLKNLGLYVGYDVDQDGPAPFDSILDYTMSIVSTGQQNLYTFFSAIPVNSIFKTFTENTSYDTFNDQANAVFQDYTSPDASSGVSVVENFDQKDYQQDPVSQYVLNIIGTPDWSNCSDSDSSSSDECLSIDKVMTTVLQDITKDGHLPGEYDYYSYKNNAKFLSQLNGNTLISPMLYSTKSNNDQGTDGLPSKSQIAQAQDFIRYAAEAVLPMASMTQSDYSKLYGIAYPPTDSEGNYTSDVDATNTMNAKVGLARYLLGLRVYAAKASVPIGNLYHILGKRMAQTSSSGDGSSSATTSQALNEFKMATWRQYDPDKQSSDQWVQKINSASAATVQKEIAILLSEMNYQMYLTRQDQERLLLTQSILLLQQLSANKPNNSIPDDVDTGSSSDN